VAKGVPEGVPGNDAAGWEVPTNGEAVIVGGTAVPVPDAGGGTPVGNPQQLSAGLTLACSKY